MKNIVREFGRFRVTTAMLLVVSLPWLSGCASRQVLPVLLLPQKGYIALPELLPDMGGIQTDFQGAPNHRSYFAVAVIPASDVFDHTSGKGPDTRSVHVRWSDGTNTEEHISGAGAMGMSGSNQELRYHVTFSLNSDSAISPTSVEIGTRKFACKVVSLKEFRKHAAELRSVK